MIKRNFSEFRRSTHHKPMVYVWRKKDGSTVKTFETEKFYCNPLGKGNFKLLSMPKFNLSFDCEWFKDFDGSYLHKSEYGTTKFIEVVKNED